MSNQYFQFKQFTIHQDRCAMKVSTDACILGAWINPGSDCKRILDIGTGTGLLALMLAQKTDAVIDAIELDTEAAEQAEENVASSGWAEKVNVINADVTEYGFQHKYDLVITNPPFFNNSLLGPAVRRNQARHTLSLNYQQLLDAVANNLTEVGKVAVLLPVDEFVVWEKLITSHGWQVAERLNIHPRLGQSVNRVVAICKQDSVDNVEVSDLYIRSAGNEYTNEFARLMHPYYLDK